MYCKARKAEYGFETVYCKVMEIRKHVKAFVVHSSNNKYLLRSLDGPSGVVRYVGLCWGGKRR
jgi:hypothetical protein